MPFKTDLSKYFFIDVENGSQVHFVRRNGVVCRSACGLTPNAGTCESYFVEPSLVTPDKICRNCKRSDIYLMYGLPKLMSENGFIDSKHEERVQQSLYKQIRTNA